jgi:signal peptidase I
MRVEREFWVPLRLHNARSLPEKHPLRTVFEAAEVVATALAAVLFLFLFVCKPVQVDGRSMEPTLRNGQMLLITSIDHTFRRGQIVVISENGTQLAEHEPIIKRIIGLPGDVIDLDMETGAVVRNGEVLTEPYTAAPITTAGDVTFPLTVLPGTCFVMGDNRNHSADSRYAAVGLVDLRMVAGHVFFPRFSTASS